jgi:hypothetical protein
MNGNGEDARRRAREAYRRRVRQAIRAADEAFQGEYAAELSQLLGLSRDEIDAISPGAADLETYHRLIAVVTEASRANVAQAELSGRIRELGEVAVSIARKIPSLAAIL